MLASIGIRGQGNALKRGFARLPNVEIKTLCDPDANLAPSRINDERLKDVASFKPGFVQDLRRALDDKDIDAIVIAAPNHWHALATVWGLQAGKHVFVEKPASHTVLEGRQMIDAAARYKKLVQVGTMNRSRPPVHGGHQVHPRRRPRQDLHGARPVLQAAPADRQVSRWPDGARREVRAHRRPRPTTSRPTTNSTCRRSTTTSGSARRRSATFNRNRFHYNWHWHWDYGNGDTGNQGPHQFDTARWGLNKQEHPVRIQSRGGYFGPEASQETPDTHTTMFEYADGTILEFATRGQFTNDEGTQTIGNLFYGTKGWLWIDANGRQWQSYFGPKNEKGPGMDVPDTSGGGGGDPRVLTSTESPHYQNFIDAIRADDAKVLNSGILDGHLSSTLPHLANIAYRVGHELRFDGKSETFVNDKKADKLLTREYRKGFEIPKLT